jgi:hypothetical protein
MAGCPQQKHRGKEKDEPIPSPVELAAEIDRTIKEGRLLSAKIFRSKKDGGLINFDQYIKEQFG